jgi:hypothetical protein
VPGKIRSDKPFGRLRGLGFEFRAVSAGPADESQVGGQSGAVADLGRTRDFDGVLQFVAQYLEPLLGVEPQVHHHGDVTGAAGRSNELRLATFESGFGLEVHEHDEVGRLQLPHELPERGRSPQALFHNSCGPG